MINSNRLSLTMLILVVSVLSGCVTKPVVFTDYDERHDFSKDTTFSWVQVPPMLKAGDYPVSPLAQTRMTAAIKNELIIKGYTFVEDLSDADLSVIYTMGARDKIRVPDYPRSYYRHRVYWGWGVHYYPFYVHYPYGYYGHGRTRDFPRSYTEGSIAIDIYDAKTQQPIWHAKASKRLSSDDLNSNASNASEVAIKLLAEFPSRITLTD